MVNYQLYRTNVLLGGQMKYDLILEPTQRGNETGIVDFHITPISKHVPYGKHIQEDLLNYSHNENIKKYYEKISSSFYKDFTNPLLTSNYPLPTGYKGEISETTYEMGCRRMTYSLYQKQHEFLCPVWLEKIDDINKLEFEFQVTVNSKSTTPIYIRKVKFDSNPKLATYFNEYINTLGLKGNGEDWVFNISQNGCQANGLNVKTGLCSVVQLPNLFNNLSSRERPLLEFNNIIINKLNEKHLITKQLFNFNLCFNFDDIMNAYIYNELHMHPIYINVVVKYDGKALDMKDIFSNHEFINKPYMHLPELDFSNPDKIIVLSKPSGENLLDYLKDDKCIDLIDKNKITQNTCHWGYCSGSGSHFNFYDGFSSLFKSPSGQNIYIPSYNENVCDINYDGSNLDTNNNITSIGYPYWCNTYNYIFPSQSGDDTTVRDTIYQNLKSLFENDSQSLWSSFYPGCIQKGIQYLGGDGCVDVLSLYTFPFSTSVVVDELLVETNNLPKMQTAETYISPNNNKNVDNVLEVLEKGIKKYLTAKNFDEIAVPLVVSAGEGSVIGTLIDSLENDYSISLVPGKSSLFSGVFNFFNYDSQFKSLDGTVTEYFKTQKTLLNELVITMNVRGITSENITKLIRDLDGCYSLLSNISQTISIYSQYASGIYYDINLYPNLFLSPVNDGSGYGYKIRDFKVISSTFNNLEFFNNKFIEDAPMLLPSMAIIFNAMNTLKTSYKMENTNGTYKSFTNIWGDQLTALGDTRSVEDIFESLQVQLIRLNEFIQYLYDGGDPITFEFNEIGVDQKFMDFYYSLQEIEGVKDGKQLLANIPKMRDYEKKYKDYIAEKQQYIFGTYVDYLENAKNESMLTLGSIKGSVDELNEVLAPNETYTTLPLALAYGVLAGSVCIGLENLMNFSLNSQPSKSKDFATHCDDLTEYLYNNDEGGKHYGDYLSWSSENTYALDINALGYQGAGSDLSTNHVIKCLLDAIEHILIIITGTCINLGQKLSLKTSQPISSELDKTNMVAAYKYFIKGCKRIYGDEQYRGVFDNVSTKLDVLNRLLTDVEYLEKKLIDLQAKVSGGRFLIFLKDFFNFVETEHSNQNWGGIYSEQNSINTITHACWKNNLMSTAVTPYFIYLAWQKYWAGVQLYYTKKGLNLDDSISNCLTLFSEPNYWKIVLSDADVSNQSKNLPKANKLINGVNKFLSKEAYGERKDICDLGSVGSSTALIDKAIKRFQTDYSGIYQTIIGGIRVVYEKNKDVVTKVLFWNLFEKASQQSLPFSKAMLYPNIIETMKNYSNIFGSIGEENNENTEVVEAKATATGLLSILNSANKEFQQLLPFRNGLTYKTANGPSLSVEEIDYYKSVLPRQISVFRELGKIKPYFIDQYSTNENYVYSKKTVEDMGVDYKKYTLTNLPPKYPSIGYFALQHSPVVYQKVDDGAKNEYNLYISNKIINLEPEFDINYSTSDAISFDISDFVNEQIVNKYKSVLGEEPTLPEDKIIYEDKIKQITSLYKLEHTHIDSEIVDNEYRTVYKLKIKLK